MLYSIASCTAYKLMSAFDHYLGSTQKLSESFHYRKNWRSSFLKKDSLSKKKTLWIHGASVGELEDLASFFLNEEKLKQCGFSFENLVLSSSSPSAQKRLQQWQVKHKVFYAGAIPPEDKKECQDFLARTNPQIFILSQSDLWPCLYRQASQKISNKSIWLPHKTNSSQKLRKPVLKPLLSCIGLRTEGTQELIKGVKHCFIGNARIDRIIERIESARLATQHPLEAYNAHPKKNKISILIGSAWRDDAKILSEAFRHLSPEEQAQFQVTVLPHDCQDSREVASIRAFLPSSKIVLKQGILLESYRSFSLVFIGGAYKTGLHNVLESLLWGIPTFCGPDLRKQPDAPELKKKNYLNVLKNSSELAVLLKEFARAPDKIKELTEKAREASQFLHCRRGATDRLIKEIKTNLQSRALAQ